jgi:hypothetical protein
MNNTDKTKGNDDQPNNGDTRALAGNHHAATKQHKKCSSNPTNHYLNKLLSESCYYLILCVSWLDAHDGAVTAIATIFIAAFTIVLAIYAGGQGSITAKQTTILDQQKNIMQYTLNEMQAEQRPFIVLKELKIDYTTGLSPGAKNGAPGQPIMYWTFTPVIENSGNTPTKYLHFRAIAGITYVNGSMYIGAAQIVYGNAQSPLKDTPWDPDDVGPYAARTVVLGPHAAQPISGFGVTDGYLTSPIGSLYIFGVIRYRDTLSDAQHVTKYCYSISGIPTIGEKKPSYGLCAHWNCADGECKQDRREYESEVKQLARTQKVPISSIPPRPTLDRSIQVGPKTVIAPIK